MQNIFSNPIIKDGPWKGYRWIEAEEAALYEREYAHAVLDLDHTGWFCDDDQCDLTKGVILTCLLGYLACCTDPDNEGALFSLAEIILDQRDAARKADRIAEWYADEQRECLEQDRIEQDRKEAEDLLDAMIDSLP